LRSFSWTFLDIGADSREEVLSWGVQLGDHVTFSRRFTIIGNGKKCVGTALDNRSGICISIEIMRSLSKSPVEADVYVSFNAQEEATIGRHAALCARIVNPQVAIEIIPSVATDYPGVREDLFLSEQGSGAVITLNERSTEDKFSGYIYHPKLVELFKKVALEHGIKYQIQPSTMYTLSGAPFIRLVHGGVPTIAIATPLRYAHSPIEMMEIADFKNIMKLVQMVLSRITSEFIIKKLPLD
jgi:endoglucanase